MAQRERLPTWREVAERAEVGRSTAADVLRSLRVEHQADEHAVDAQRVNEFRVDERKVDSRELVTDEHSAKLAPIESEPAEPLSSPDRAPEPDRAAVSRARDAVARAAVSRAAERATQRAEDPDRASGDAVSRERAQQLALWESADLDTATARDPTPDAGSGDATGSALVGSEDDAG